MAATNPIASMSITLGRELSEVADTLRHSTVQILTANYGRGSGVIWRPNGIIVTNAHVASSSRHRVLLSDGRVFEAQTVLHNPQLDLAILRVDVTGLPAVKWRNPSELRAGELVVAVGNPFDASGALAVGLLAARPKRDAFVRADIRLSPGNSGGPLADVNGAVVGINSMVVDGFGVAVNSVAVSRCVTAALSGSAVEVA